MTAYDDLDEITREFFAGRNTVQEMLDARRAAEQAPPPEPTIIPMPEFIGGRGRLISTVIRYPCTVPGGGCPWGYVVDVGLRVAEKFTLSVSGFPEGLDRAITDQAAQRLRDLRERIEEAFGEHFELFHPGQEPPDQIERLQREEAARRAAQC